MTTLLYKGGDHQDAGMTGTGIAHCRIEVVTMLINRNLKFGT